MAAVLDVHGKGDSFGCGLGLVVVVKVYTSGLGIGPAFGWFDVFVSVPGEIDDPIFQDASSRHVDSRLFDIKKPA